jgi:hypothetical protein
VGTGIGVTNKKEEYNEIYSGGSFATIVDYTGKKNAVVVAPFVRKYWTLSDNLYIFGQLEIPMEFGKMSQDALVTYMDVMYGYTDYQTFSIEKIYLNRVNVKPGLDYFLNKNWSIEATIGVRIQNFKYKEEGRSS